MKTHFDFLHNAVYRMVLFAVMITLAFSCEEGENNVIPSGDNSAQVPDLSKLLAQEPIFGKIKENSGNGLLEAKVDPTTPKNARPMISVVENEHGRTEAPPNPANWTIWASTEFNQDNYLGWMWNSNYPWLNGNVHLHNHQAYMISENLAVNQGVLTLTAKHERHPNAPDHINHGGKKLPIRFTSAAVHSRNNFRISQSDIQNGIFIESGIAISSTKGAWSAFWALSHNPGWPPELDMLETPIHINNPNFSVEQSQRQVYTNYHYKDPAKPKGRGSWGAYHYVGSDLGQHFHIYGTLWVNNRLEFYVDGRMIRRWTMPARYRAQMDKMYLIMNLAIGGWPGILNNNNINIRPESQFPTRMFCDYVRVYRRN